LGDHVICLDSPVDVCYVTAGAILISEKRVSNLRELSDFLTKAGMSSDRRNPVLQSLTPFAEVMLNTQRKQSWISRFFS
jgi:hypothetical protein